MRKQHKTRIQFGDKTFIVHDGEDAFEQFMKRFLHIGKAGKEKGE
jgi:hypothetical protein